MARPSNPYTPGSPTPRDTSPAPDNQDQEQRLQGEQVPSAAAQGKRTSRSRKSLIPVYEEAADEEETPRRSSLLVGHPDVDDPLFNINDWMLTLINVYGHLEGDALLNELNDEAGTVENFEATMLAQSKVSTRFTFANFLRDHGVYCLPEERRSTSVEAIISAFNESSWWSSDEAILDHYKKHLPHLDHVKLIVQEAERRIAVARQMAPASPAKTVTFAPAPIFNEKVKITGLPAKDRHLAFPSMLKGLAL